MGRTVVGAVKKLDEIGLGKIRESQRGVPHLVYNGISVVWFWRESKYRVFWPWPSFENQKRRDFAEANEVKKFLLSSEDK